MRMLPENTLTAVCLFPGKIEIKALKLIPKNE